MGRKMVSGTMLTLLLIGMLILTFNIRPVKAEPSARAQPPWFDFGTVYTNCRINASCMIRDTTMNGIRSTPDWIEIDLVDTTHGWFYFHVNTANSGNYSGIIRVETIEGDIDVSVNVAIRTTPTPKLKMLIFETPFDMYSTSDPENMKPMTRVMDIGYVNVSYSFDFLPPEDYDLLLIAESGLVSLTENQIDSLKSYVNNGGSLIVCADHFYLHTVDKANQIINDFGLSMRDEEYGYEVLVTDFATHPITSQVETIRHLRPSPVEEIPDSNMTTTILARPPGVPLNEGVLAISEGNGNLIVLGNSLWWYNFLKWGEDYDNSQIFLNTFDYISRGARARSTLYPWSMFRHNLRHTGYTESPAPRTNQTLWNYTTGGWVYSSPAVADGKVYVGSWDKEVHCLDASTGAHIWNYTTGYSVYSSPAVADGKVYVGSYDDKVYCLDASTGAHIWNYTTGDLVSSSPAVADGKVYVGSGAVDKKVYCLDASTGDFIWSYTTGGSVHSSPAVADGKVYVGSYDDKVYCLDASTGAHIWNYTTGSYVSSSPAVADGKVYVGSYYGKVYCLDASTGAHIWNYTIDDLLTSSPAVADGRVYVGSWDREVYCLDASTGDFIWSYTTGGRVESSPAVADGKVYVGSRDDEVYCLDASTGDFIWSYTTGDWVVSSPAVADGVVFVGSLDHAVYAFGNVFRVPEDYPTIQEAIDAATAACIPGATISIAAGIYHEYLTINKTLTLLGRPGSTPKFNGSASGIAVTITDTYEVIVTNINITNYEKAILVDNSSDCKIYNNIMSNMVYSGITSKGDNAVNNRIYNNIFENDNNIAIDLTESSNSNTIYSNTISSNNIGLNLLESNGNTIYANTISQNEIGINISSSSYNTIYHNNFIDNTQQVSLSNPSSNTWDNGYPSGGNHWSNYNGTDANGDGIGDTPYEIDANNRDRYPLMEPWPCEITPRAPVGGIHIPVDRFALLAPYIGLVSTILVATAATAVYVKRVKHRKARLLNS